MDITLYISRFLYRIRYQLIFGSIIVTALVAYFTQFMTKTYTVNTSIYTGIASSTGLDSDDKPDWMSLNNSFDNLINLTKAKGTLEKVSLNLLALNAMHGDSDNDNQYITAKNYKELKKILPEDVFKLIDKNSLEKTINNLNKYKQADPDNFLYELFNREHPHYSYTALKDVSVKRLGNSDIIEISFKSNDPGIAMNTVKLINEKLIESYDSLKYKAANDVIKYYEEQLKILRTKLDNLENNLTKYNVENGVINYLEQTKAIAIAFTAYEDRYEQTAKEYQSSKSLVAELEKQMETRTKLFKTNFEFINALNEISTINGKITEMEIFNAENSQASNKELEQYKQDLKNAEKKIGELSTDMNVYKYSKEGVAIDDMVNQWLTETVRNAKAKAELKVLDARRKDFSDQYKTFSPIGTQINRMEREIKVTEQSYIEVLHALNLAMLKQKNIQLTSATLNTITPPTFPLTSDGSKRLLFTIAAFFGSLIFITGCYLVIELLDRTLRDAERTRRLTDVPVLGAFTGHSQLKYRGYTKACNRISAAYACSHLNKFLSSGKTTCINILSIEDGEGKSFISSYLIEQWKEQGLKVRYLKAERDFQIDNAYLFSVGFDYFKLKDEKESPDILLIEHLSLQKNSLSLDMIKKADANLLITNARRVWKYSDNEFIAYLKDIGEAAPLFIYLNNATREAVEDFTGQLPPQSSMRTFANRMMYMGLTARDAAVKQSK